MKKTLKSFSAARVGWQIFALSAITLVIGSIVATITIGATEQALNHSSSNNTTLLNFIYGFFTGAILAVLSGVAIIYYICRKYHLSDPIKRALIMLAATGVPAVLAALLLFGWPLFLLPGWAGLIGYALLKRNSGVKKPGNTLSHAAQ